MHCSSRWLEYGFCQLWDLGYFFLRILYFPPWMKEGSYKLASILLQCQNLFHCPVNLVSLPNSCSGNLIWVRWWSTGSFCLPPLWCLCLGCPTEDLTRKVRPAGRPSNPEQGVSWRRRRWQESSWSNSTDKPQCLWELQAVFSAWYDHRAAGSATGSMSS